VLPLSLRRAARIILAVALLSSAAGVPVAAQSDCVTVEDFASAPIGEFPPGWRARTDDGKEVYSVQAEDGIRFLRAVARRVGVQAGKTFEWDLAAYPVLVWRWRPREFPIGADERKSSTNDSALAVYAVFPHTPITLKSVKYIWSERVPAETHLTSSHGFTQVRVLRSGPPNPQRWIEERVNVMDDYRRLFRESDPPRPYGIGVLTDSDDTKSGAQGDYASFRVCRG
jgi:DUF3047 family protein